MYWKSKVLIVAMMIAVLLMAVWPAAAHAQTAQPVYCDNLEQSDCELLAKSSVAMSELQAAANRTTVEFLASHIPNAPFDTISLAFGQQLAYVLSDEAAAIRAELRGMHNTNPAAFQESPEALLRRYAQMLAGTDFDSVMTLHLSEDVVTLIEEAAEKEGEPLPFDFPSVLTLRNRLVDNTLYVNVSDLAQFIPGLTAVGDIWFGVRFGSVLDLALDQIFAQADLSAMDEQTRASFAQLVSAPVAGVSGPVVTSLALSPLAPQVLPFLDVERLEDRTVADRPVAVFRTSADYAALLADPFVQGSLVSLLRNEGFVPPQTTEVELAGIVSLVETLGPSILESLGLEIIERIDVQTGLLLDSELTLNLETEQLVPLLGLSGDFDLPQGEELPVISLTARSAYETENVLLGIVMPDTALIVEAEQFPQLFQGMSESAPDPSANVVLPVDAAVPFAEAISLSEAGDYAAALPLFAQAISLDPENAEYYTQRARTHYFAGDYELALADFDTAIQLEPAAVRYNGRGAAYDELGQPDQALADYDRALQLDPDFAYAHHNRGIILQDRGEYDLAIAAFSAAIEADPANAGAFSGRGGVFYALGDYEQAILDFNSALELDSNFAMAYLNRGDAYSALGQYEQALADYDAAIDLAPDLVRAYNNRGVTHYNLGDYEQALADYNLVLELDPAYVFAHVNRGDAYHSLGHFEQAIENFDRAIELDPSNAYAYFARGLAYYELDDIEQEIAEYSKAIELDPEYVTAYYYRGLSYDFLGEYEAALADYSRTIELEPNYTDAYYDRGVLYTVLEEFEQALADFEQVLQLDSLHGQAYRERGYLYQAWEENDKAIADLNRYLKLTPDAEDRAEVEAAIEAMR